MDRDAFVAFFCEARKCKPSSAATIYYTVRRVRKENGLSEKIPRNHKWVTLPNKQIHSDSPNVLRNLTTAIVTYLKALGDVPQKKIDTWVDAMTSHAKKVDIIYASGEKSEKQKKNWITRDQVTRFMREKTRLLTEHNLWAKKEWDWEDRKLAQEALVLSLHATNPPRLELSSMIYVNAMKDMGDNNNYLVYRPKKGWFARVNVGKTVKDGEHIDIKLSLPTARLLNRLKRYLRPGEPVFQTRYGNQMTRNGYGKMIRRLFKKRYGKSVSASLLRTIFVSEKWKNVPQLQEIADTAHAMMHSVRTHLGRYKKKL